VDAPGSSERPRSDLDPRVLQRLRCPVCGESLHQATDTRALRCPRRHSFDIARQGYVNLLAGRAPHTGATAEMVAARADFLAAGHYDVIASALTVAASEAVGRPEAGFGAYPLVVDAGAGTGRYLGAVLAALPDAVGLALDVSKPALRRAARAHPLAAAALADTWRRLPLADASAAVLLNVFAPRNGAEVHRVLDPAGTLLVVTPDGDHLAELVDALDLLRVDPDKAERVTGSLGGHFTLADSAVHRAELALTRNEVATLVGMGPSAWHTDPGALADRMAALPEPIRVTVAVRVDHYRPR
jgi:SAM-dependent methyltransferase